MHNPLSRTLRLNLIIIGPLAVRLKPKVEWGQPASLASVNDDEMEESVPDGPDESAEDGENQTMPASSRPGHGFGQPTGEMSPSY